MRRVARSALLVLIFTMPWENLYEVGSVARVSKLVGAGAALVWLLAVVVTGTVRRPRPVHVAVLMFATWNLLSLLWSQDPATTLGQSLTYVQLALLVFVLYDTFRTLGDLRAAMQAYVLGCWVTVISLLAKYLSGGAEEAVRFTTGTFEVNSLGLVIGLAIPFAWYLAVGQREHARPSLLTMPNLVYIPVAVVAVLLTGSRSRARGRSGRSTRTRRRRSESPAGTRLRAHRDRTPRVRAASPAPGEAPGCSPR